MLGATVDGEPALVEDARATEADTALRSVEDAKRAVVVAEGGPLSF